MKILVILGPILFTILFFDVCYVTSVISRAFTSSLLTLVTYINDIVGGSIEAFISLFFSLIFLYTIVVILYNLYIKLCYGNQPADTNLPKDPDPKDNGGYNGPGPDSHQGGGGSSSGMNIGNFTPECPLFDPNHEQWWSENLEVFIRNFLDLIPEQGNFPPLSMIYWFVKFALIAFSNIYYFIWANVHSVSEYFSNYNYLSSIIDTLKDGFNYCYEEGYMLLWSAFPDKLPPLPGRTPLSSIMIIMYLVHLYIFFKLYANIQKLIYLTFKFLSYLILPSFPFFVIKYLFLFDKKIQLLWAPLITLLHLPISKRNTKFYDHIVAYYVLRRYTMSIIIIYLIRAIYNIILACFCLYLINLNGV